MLRSVCTVHNMQNTLSFSARFEKNVKAISFITDFFKKKLAFVNLNLSKNYFNSKFANYVPYFLS